ncbi:maleylpyruvate isomerase family mycothiol-dependent enzyme [Pseudonocardia sp. GCM10023141]|uniref:maleylpyruvate isomerase family mycothiol-dependent enzyme n=1 Tax=Pseudonocardia sp. GCM10023141 TaxID=3252653 RepID=UPI0036235B5D
MTAAVDATAFAHDERAELAELLGGLTPEQWNAPTLCSEWRVRDVVAHMFSYEDVGMGALIGRFVAGGLNADRMNAAAVARFANHSTDDLLERVRQYLDPSGLTAKFGGRIALTDGMVHQQDIRRPLGLPREIPAERLLCALPFACTARPLGARRRIDGLSFTTTDLDWSTGTGTGPVIEGPAEAVLMAIAGRRESLTELIGPGKPLLAERISAEHRADPRRAQSG